ncbi:MAG: hypothetical protein DWQ37_22475 [Planctomycetota bacterium]|nr:MAG: hypothetical protein DWQ37_22475 [Planctomycetota bacterium]
MSVTPYGRRRYVEILVRYLLGLRDLIDEHHFWINTDCPEDVQYARDLAAAYPDFFRLVHDSSRYSRKSAVPRICWFWQKCDEDHTLYLKLDDDLVWIDDGAIERLLQFRLDHPQYLTVFPNTVNNSLCSHLHQKQGLLADTPAVEYECLGDVSWRRWRTAHAAHETFFDLRAAGELHKFHFDTWELTDYERFSINAMCWLGRDLAEPARRFADDDEAWVTEHVPRETGRTTAIVGDALVAHFAYAPQRGGLETYTDVLARYRALAATREMHAPVAPRESASVGRRLRHLSALAAGFILGRRAA